MSAVAPVPLSSPQAVLEAIDAELAALSTETFARGKELALKGQSVAAYARQAKDPKLIKLAVAATLKAQRRCGELLIEMGETGARQTRGGDRGAKSRDGTLRLVDLGVTKKQSSAWQALARLEDDLFATCIAGRTAEALHSLSGSSAERAAEKKQARAAREVALGEKQRALPQRKFGVIYCDPEWRFEVRSDKGLDRSAENHYPCSDLETICARDVGSIPADDCVLFLWVTMPMLGRMHEVLAAWGFEYKSAHVWVKDGVGNGYWVRDNAELLIIATRGNVPAPAPGTQLLTAIGAPKGEHSAKPEIFAEHIERLFPNLLKIELNRRGPPRPGWEAWGNEAQPASGCAGAERAGKEQE